MIDTLKSILGFGPTVDYTALMKNGAIIVDVRSKGEYASGHIEGSMNIPVDQLRSNLSRLPDKGKIIITCCASGGRSGQAKNLLDASGYKQVYNGGGWLHLKGRLN